MNDQFVTYQIAKKLKELKFNKMVIAYYQLNIGEIDRPTTTVNLEYNSIKGRPIWYVVDLSYPDVFAAPLWQQAIDFCREKGIYIIELLAKYDDENAYKVSDCTDDKDCVEYGGYKREQAILKAIELIQQNAKK